jgi:hypothetical protein
MRLLARIGYTLAGLALMAPAAARAGMPIPAPGPYTAGMPTSKATALKKKQSEVRLCANCQRLKLMKETGANIPIPEPLPPGIPVAGQECTKCGAPTAVVLSGPLPPRSTPAIVGDRSAPGLAVVGGDDSSAVGYAANGADPVPIGTVQPRLASTIPMPSRPGSPRDGSVMPTSMAPEPIAPKAHNRPHMLSHLFGISAIGRDWAEARERKAEEKHASIPYGPQTSKVTELPASMVYGR